MQHLLKTLLLASTLICQGITTAGAAADTTTPEAVNFSLNGAAVEGNERAPATFELLEVDAETKEVGMVRFTLKHAKTYNALRVTSSVPVNVRTYNTMTFKIKVENPQDGSFDMGIRLLDKRGGWVATRVGKYIVRQEAGKEVAPGEWQTFQWDIINQPDTVVGMDKSVVTRVSFHPRFKDVPAGGQHSFLIKDIQFISGKSVRAGDPELYAKWQAQWAAYTPDYSDSSHYLQPPVTGRIAKPLALVHNGQAVSQIVLPAQAGATLQMASEELAHWLNAITGARVPVRDQAVTATETTAKTTIKLGSEQARSRFAKDIQQLANTDGYAVRAHASDIYIFGATDKGTLNGVYAFLENNTDLIWPRPLQELGAVYSHQSNLNAVWADALSRPTTRLRGWATNNGQRPPHELWANRNKLNYPTGGGTDLDGSVRRRAAGNYIEFGGGHNLHAWVDKDQPRFFPTIDGKKPEKLNVWKHQLCFSQPDLPEIYTRNLLEYIKTKTPVDIDCMNVKIEDNWGVCECELCLSPLTLPDGRVLQNNDPAFRSTQFFIFLNAVTQGVNKVYPNLHIGTYAYFFTSTPPAVEVDKHIRIYFCPYVRKDQGSPLCSPINDHWWRMLTSWAKKSNNVVIREYYGIFSGFRPLADVIAFDVRSYAKMGVLEDTSELNPDENFLYGKGTLRGGGREWDFMAMDYWVVNRIYWDDTQDVEQLRKYYLRRTYREAAPAMERFFGDIRQEFYASDQPSGFVELSGMAKQMFVGKPLGDSSRSQLADAMQAVKHPVSRMLLDVLSERFEQTIELALDPKKAAIYNGLTPEVVMQYGWGPSNRWSSTTTAWTAATYLQVDGKTVHAVRLNLEPVHAKAGETVRVRNGYLSQLSWGDSLSMTVRRNAADIGRSPVKISIEVLDKFGHPHAAPAEAYVTLPDGSVRVSWTLVKPTGEQAAWHLEGSKGVTLAFDFDEAQAKESHVYYLTDFSAKQNTASADAR